VPQTSDDVTAGAANHPQPEKCMVAVFYLSTFIIEEVKIEEN
jgi:hypothetical protein